jgi:hypothetical protein
VTVDGPGPMRFETLNVLFVRASSVGVFPYSQASVPVLQAIGFPSGEAERGRARVSSVGRQVVGADEWSIPKGD